MKTEQLRELLLQALETELRGVRIYEAAIQCATSDDLRGQWDEYLEQTKNHVKVVLHLCERLGVDPGDETPGRAIVRQIGEALLKAILTAEQMCPAEAAQIVASECVVLAETKDRLNWALIGLAAEDVGPRRGEALRAARAQVEEQEDEHLHRATDWCRELWIGSLGMPSVLPPPVSDKGARAPIGPARAGQSRKEML